jgi:hypothetical protein
VGGLTQAAIIGVVVALWLLLEGLPPDLAIGLGLAAGILVQMADDAVDHIRARLRSAARTSPALAQYSALIESLASSKEEGQSTKR